MMKHVKVFEDFLNENFKSFSDLEFAIDQHEKDNHVYDLTKIVNIFNQLSSADQLKARKKYGDKFFPKLNEETADNGDTLGELNDMTLGQLERIGDYAKMIKDRMMKGEQLESWMYSQLTIALENLNSVHDAMDGNDGTVEESEEINEAIDIKYWTDYNTDTSGQSDPEFAIKSKDFEATFKEAVKDWNDIGEDPISMGEAEKVKKIAKEFFNKAGWISVNVAHAMIAQES